MIRINSSTQHLTTLAELTCVIAEDLIFVEAEKEQVELMPLTKLISVQVCKGAKLTDHYL